MSGNRRAGNVDRETPAHTRPERFPPGDFRKGDAVRLRRPGQHREFENPKGIFIIDDAYYTKPFEPPTYVISEPGGTVGCTPYRDADLRKARNSKSVQKEEE